MNLPPERKYRLLPAALIVLFAAAMILLSEPPAHAASQNSLYRDGLREFRALKGSSRAKYRDAWMRVHGIFQDAVNKGPDTVTGAKSLYYIARTWEELGKRSFLSSDFIRAADNYQRAANRFPVGHSWVDDALYRKAEIRAERLGNKTGAAADLRLLLSAHKNGDQAGKARALLAKLGAESTSAPARPKKAYGSVSASELKKDYQNAFSAFKRLRAKPRAYQREDYMSAIERFRRLADADPDGPYAGKALYFIGFTYAVMAEVSFRESDYIRAADYFRQSADAFDKDHSWIDDALYRRAEILKDKLNDPDQAYADLLEIVHEHSGGDKAGEARQMLAEMDNARAGRIADSMTGTPEVAGQTAKPEPGPEHGGRARLKDIRYRTSDDYTRIVLDMSKSANFISRELPPDPARRKSHRMFVDLANTRLDPNVENEINIGAGFLRRVRTGQNTHDTARVVLDFTEKKKYHVFALENPYRIVIDVFAQQAPGSKQKSTVAAGSERYPGEPDRKPTQREKNTAADVLSQLGLTVQTVMIDPGHGGNDPGAVRYVKSGGRRKIDILEKTITQRLANILGRKLTERGYRVLYTRDRDKYVSLEDRAVTANLKGADLFISLHANANRSSKVRGFETYYLGKARNDVVLKLAAKENNVDPAKISDTQKIVMDLVHSFKLEESRDLAKTVQKHTISQIRNRYGDVRDNGARSAPFFVLIGAKMPAILLEIGYTTHPVEAKRLKSDAYLSIVADGIADGVEAYKKSIKTAGL
jgi:N-acetylmuramoyl-L-alanine amidase